MDMKDSNVGVAFYAAVTAIEDGKIAEAEIEHRVTTGSGDREEIFTITVRKHIKRYTAAPQEDD